MIPSPLRVPGLVDVEIVHFRGLGWTVYRAGQRLPRGRSSYKVRRASDGRWVRRTVTALVWAAGPGPDKAWDYTGLRIPGFANYRLDGEPGHWEVRSYARHGGRRPGAQIAQCAHPVDYRPIVTLVDDAGRHRTQQVSRLVLLAHAGEPLTESAIHCRHLDGNWGNDTPQNLAWGTVSENAQDREAHGTRRGITPGGRKRELDFDEEVAA